VESCVVRQAGPACLAATLSRLESHGISAVAGKTFEHVINALKQVGVEIEGNTLRLTKKPRR
ncbi:MAG: hypothetical protein WCD29_17200, partial [Pseudolabrys sp.]